MLIYGNDMYEYYTVQPNHMKKQQRSIHLLVEDRGNPWHISLDLIRYGSQRVVVAKTGQLEWLCPFDSKRTTIIDISYTNAFEELQEVIIQNFVTIGVRMVGFEKTTISGLFGPKKLMRR